MKLRAILAIALAACVLLGWWLFSNSAERQIRKLFDQVSHELEKTGPEHTFREFSKAKALSRHVGARLSIDGLGGRRDLVLNHEALPQQIAIFRREVQTFSVSFDQLTVKVSADKSAQAFCNVICNHLPAWAGDSTAYALTATLRKNDSGDWLFVVLHFAPLVP